MKFYKQIHNFKYKRKFENAVVFNSTQESVKPKTLMVPSTSPDPI